MRVAINTRLLIKNKLDGIGRFTYEILKRLSMQNPDIEFHFIFDREFSRDFLFSKNVIPHIISPQTRHPILWYIWLEIRLPKLIKKINPDLFLSLDGFMSTRISTPTIIAIHDINFEHRPKDLACSHSFFYRKYMRKYAELADQIITVSEFSKQDIIKQYGVNKNKINIVHNGVSDIFSPITEKLKVEIKNKYSEDENFFVFIGSLHKRKNIKNLLLAFDLFRQENKKSKNKLLLIGRKKWWDNETKNVYKNMIFKYDVVFLGPISDKKMSAILASAKGLCFTSIFEGFGLPIIEAMKSQVPVITSNTSSMPEIAQDAALLVNPFDVHAIKDAMEKIEFDEDLRSKLIKRGDARSKMFNWDISAKKVLQIINSYKLQKET